METVSNIAKSASNRLSSVSIALKVLSVVIGVAVGCVAYCVVCLITDDWHTNGPAVLIGVGISLFVMWANLSISNLLVDMAKIYIENSKKDTAG